MTNTTRKRLAVGVGVTLGFMVLLGGVLTVVFGIYAAWVSAITPRYGITAAILTMPFVYVIMDEFRTWLRREMGLDE